MSEIIDRLKAKTPNFFKFLRNLGIIVALWGTTMLGIDNAPEQVKDVAKYAIAIGSTIGLVSQLTKKDTTDESK